MNAEIRVSDPLSTQRVDARGRLAVRAADGCTRLSELYQEGAAKIRLPHRSGSDIEAVMINTAGGLTGGDRVSWAVDAASGTSLTITTQACERIYRSAAGEARVRSTVKMGKGARLAWLPQETILFQRGALRRSLEIELGDGTEALVVEAVLLGRLAHGETVTTARLTDKWRVSCGGRLVHAEEWRLGPDIAGQAASSAGTRGNQALATVLLIAKDAEAHLPNVRDIIGNLGGASFWQVGRTGKLLARLAAEDGYMLRRRLVPLLSLLNGQASLPKTWSL